MGLHDIKPGLGNPTRRLILDGKSAAKVALVVAPGDELVVSEDVAAQLVAADGGFKPATDEKRETWDGIYEDAVAHAEAEQAAAVALSQSADTPVAPVVAPVAPVVAPAPVKKAAAKKSAAKRDDA